MLKVVVYHQANSGNIKAHHPRIAKRLKLSALCENLSLKPGRTRGQTRILTSTVQREETSQIQEDTICLDPHTEVRVRLPSPRTLICGTPNHALELR